MKKNYQPTKGGIPKSSSARLTNTAHEISEGCASSSLLKTKKLEALSSTKDPVLVEVAARKQSCFVLVSATVRGRVNDK